MVEITMRMDASELDRRIGQIRSSHLPRVIVDALNETAFGARRAVQDAMDKTFDGLTPYARRGVTVVKAGSGRVVAEVEFSGSRSQGGLPPAYFMRPNVEGGRRSLKAFERQLQDRGVLKTGEVAVPTQRAPRDRYGNVTQGQLNRIMTGLEIDYRGAGATRLASTGKGRRKVRSRGRYFVPKRGSHLAPGIWHEPGFPAGVIYPVFYFQPSPAYSKMLDFEGVVRRHAQTHLPVNLRQAWARRIR